MFLINLGIFIIKFSDKSNYFKYYNLIIYLGIFFIKLFDKFNMVN